MRDLRFYLTDANNNIDFVFRRNSQAVSGHSLIAQRIIKTLFTKAGSNIWSPNEGTPLAELVGGTYDPNDEDNLRLVIKLSINQAEHFIKKQQLTQIKLANNEKLKKIELIDVVFNTSSSGFSIFIKINTLAGTSFFVKV